jgi:hypothetical protein
VDAATNSAPAGFPPSTWRLETEPSRGAHSFVRVIIEQKWEHRYFRMWGRKVGAPLLPRVWEVGAAAGGEGGWGTIVTKEGGHSDFEEKQRCASKSTGGEMQGRRRHNCRIVANLKSFAAGCCLACHVLLVTVVS